jgi:hypothetical protein
VTLEAKRDSTARDSAELGSKGMVVRSPTSILIDGILVPEIASMLLLSPPIRQSNISSSE